MAAFIIREAREDDCEDIMQLIKELAVCQKFPVSAVTLTSAGLKRDGFGQNPMFHVCVAELTPEGSEEGRQPLVGFALYVHMYDAFTGPPCFLADFYVKEEWRNKGIGSALWAAFSQRALSRGCKVVNWTVFDWNQRAIDFYKRKGAQDLTKDKGYLFFMMDTDAMEQVVAAHSRSPNAAQNTK
ncbi:hypothetical protein ACOMHN_026604 [Nucella lapillus]